MNAFSIVVFFDTLLIDLSHASCYETCKRALVRTFSGSCGWIVTSSFWTLFTNIPSLSTYNYKARLMSENFDQGVEPKQACQEYYPVKSLNRKYI